MTDPFRDVYRRSALAFLEHGDEEVLREELKDSPHLEAIMSLLTGDVEERVVGIPPGEGEWFSIKEDHEYWPAYLELLSDPNGKDMAKPAVSIDRSTTDLMNRLFDPRAVEAGAENHRYGMVVGYVQSGKTAHFTGLIAKAADSGFDLVVVLSGIFNDLREQTQARLCKELAGTLRDVDGCDVCDVEFSNPWHMATGPDPGQDFHEMRHTHDLSMINDERPVLVVTKKNVSPLEQLIEWVGGLDEEKRSLTKLLLVDDECDYASINTNAPGNRAVGSERDPTRINGLLRELLSMFDNYAYVGYTASPFANVFIHPDGDGTPHKTLYPRDFVMALPRPVGHHGFPDLFPGDDSETPVRIVEERNSPNDPMKEADIVRQWTDRPFSSPSADMSECPGLRNALIEYLLSGSIRRIRGHAGRHHSMLIHTKRTTRSMKPIRKKIQAAMRTWGRALMRRRPEKLRGKKREVYEAIRDHYIDVYSHEIEDAPDWGDVHEEIRQFVRKIRTLEINYDTKESLNYHQYSRGRYVIAIGGDRLSRGLTLEGLCISYFIRTSQTPKADTMMQMGRWFGFRPDYSDLVRMYTTPALNEIFELIGCMEEFLREEVERLDELGATPDDFALRVMRSSDLLPTADLKMRNVRVFHSFHAEIWPKQGKFHFDDKEKLSQNLQHVGGMLNRLEEEPNPVGGSWLWEGVGLDWAQETIQGLKLPNDAFKIDELASYFDRRRAAGRGELTKWSVALIGLNVKDPRKARTEKMKLGGREIYTVKRTRLKGTDNVGFFPAPDDFVIDIEGDKSQFKIDGKLRYSRMFNARLPENPLMLIYVIDKESKANSKRRMDLFPEGDGEHVVAISIALPSAEISEREKEEETQMWANAFRDTMPYADNSEEE